MPIDPGPRDRRIVPKHVSKRTLPVGDVLSDIRLGIAVAIRGEERARDTINALMAVVLRNNEPLRSTGLAEDSVPYLAWTDGARMVGLLIGEDDSGARVAVDIARGAEIARGASLPEVATAVSEYFLEKLINEQRPNRRRKA